MLSPSYMASLRAITSDTTVMANLNQYGGYYSKAYAEKQQAGAGSLPTDHGTTHIRYVLSTES